MLFGRSGGISWLVVGLGNPGTQYESTRHNMGFLAVDKLAQEENFRFSKLRFKAWTATWEVGGQKVLVMKPQTYMNLSGESVGEAARFYKIPPEHVLVISDDIDLPAGRLRIRPGGSAGGHNGLKSVIERTGSPDFLRLRLGVGRDAHNRANVVGHVLGRFSPDDRKVMDEVVAEAIKAIGAIELESPEIAMNRYNGWMATSAAAGKENDT